MTDQIIDGVFISTVEDARFSFVGLAGAAIEHVLHVEGRAGVVDNRRLVPRHSTHAHVFTSHIFDHSGPDERRVVPEGRSNVQLYWGLEANGPNEPHNADKWSAVTLQLTPVGIFADPSEAIHRPETRTHQMFRFWAADGADNGRGDVVGLVTGGVIGPNVIPDQLRSTVRIGVAESTFLEISESGARMFVGGVPHEIIGGGGGGGGGGGCDDLRQNVAELGRVVSEMSGKVEQHERAIAALTDRVEAIGQQATANAREIAGLWRGLRDALALVGRLTRRVVHAGGVLVGVVDENGAVPNVDQVEALDEAVEQLHNQVGGRVK